MRDLLIMSMVCAGALAALRRPWIGVIVWVWVSIMNPHRYAWSFAYDAPVGTIAAIGLLLGLLFNKDQRESPFKGPPVAWLSVFIVWITISWLFGFDPAGDYYQWIKVIKILMMVMVGLAVLRTKMHIFAFAWASALSMGLLGAKGGYFTLVTGGDNRVWGPEGSFIGDNNEFALACVMAIPLLRFLQMQLPLGWQRHAMTAMMTLCVAAALGSQSRGSFLALVAMGVFLWWRGGNRFIGGIVIFGVGFGLIAFMPEGWLLRMHSIDNYETDASAQGRFSAWWTAFGIAKDYVTGVGFLAARHELFARYSPIYPLTGSVHAAHSIYFQILGNHGFVGLFLFLGIWFSTWRSAAWLRKQAKLHVQALWASQLGGMIQVSLVGYLVGGMFLSLSYFDLAYNLMALAALSVVWVKTRAWEREPVYKRRWNTIPGLVSTSAVPKGA